MKDKKMTNIKLAAKFIKFAFESNHPHPQLK